MFWKSLGVYLGNIFGRGDLPLSHYLIHVFAQQQWSHIGLSGPPLNFCYLNVFPCIFLKFQLDPSFESHGLSGSICLLELLLFKIFFSYIFEVSIRSLICVLNFL